MSDINLHLNPTQLDPEPKQPVVGFRPHQSLTQLATHEAHQRGILIGTIPFWEQLHLKGLYLISISFTMIKVYPYSQPT